MSYLLEDTNGLQIIGFLVGYCCQGAFCIAPEHPRVNFRFEPCHAAGTLHGFVCNPTAVAIAYYPVIGPHPPIAIDVLLLRLLLLPIILQKLSVHDFSDRLCYLPFRKQGIDELYERFFVLRASIDRWPLFLHLLFASHGERRSGGKCAQGEHCEL